MIYPDSYALVKLLQPEQKATALRTFLSAHAEGHAISALTQAELARTPIRADPDVADAAGELRDRMLRIRITDPILRAAGLFPIRHPRSLDGSCPSSAP